MVNGRPALWNHCGQVIEKKGQLVVSEANYPRHEYTPVDWYMDQQDKGKFRLAIMRINEGVWDGRQDHADLARYHCEKFHLYTCRNRRYTAGIFLPMSGLSMVRNLTPFLRKRFENIPDKGLRDIFICSWIVDVGWDVGQLLTGLDWFKSSLHSYVSSPEDIYESPVLDFVSGHKPTRVPLRAQGPERYAVYDCLTTMP